MTVSSFEEGAFDELCELVGEDFDEIKRDAVGNVILLRKCGKDNAQKILIDTHFDEIGMMVTDIKDGGFLSVTSIGGLDRSILQASDVIIYGKERIRGVIASTPPHLRSSGDSDKTVPIDELLIDTGYSKEEISELVPIGTAVGFAPRYTELLDGCIAGKSFDDKACAAVAVHALSKISADELAGDVYLVLSCHEETVRIGGIAPAAFSLEPDYAMVIDVNFARTPDTPKAETLELKGGVSIAHSPITDRRLTLMTEELCRSKDIKFARVAAPSTTGTNTPALNLVGRGVPTVDIGLPIKSMHTYNEILNLEDAETLGALLRGFVCSNEIKEAFAE